MPEPEELGEEAQEAAAQEEKKAARYNAERFLADMNRPNNAAGANPGNPPNLDNPPNPGNPPLQPPQPPPPPAPPNAPAVAPPAAEEEKLARQVMEEAQAEILDVKDRQRLLNQLRDASVDPLLSGSIAFTLIFNYQSKSQAAAGFLFDRELRHPGLNPYVIMLFNSQFAETAEGKSRYNWNMDRDIALKSMTNVVLYGKGKLGRKNKRTWSDVVDEVGQRLGNIRILPRAPEPTETLSEAYLYSMTADNAYRERNPFPSDRFKDSIARYTESAYASLRDRLRNERIWHREAALCILTVDSLLRGSDTLATYRLNYKTASFVNAQLGFQFALNLNDQATFYRFWHLAAVCKFMLCCSGLVPMHLLAFRPGEREDVEILGLAVALFGRVVD